MSGQDQTMLEKNDKISDSNEENKKQKQKRIIDIAAYNLEYKALEDIVFIVKGIDNDFEMESSPTDENGSAAVYVPEAGKYSVSLKEGTKGLEPADGKAKKVITFTDKDKVYKDGNIYHQGMFKFKDSKDLEKENKQQNSEDTDNKNQDSEKIKNEKDENAKQHESENLFLEAKNRFNKKTPDKNKDNEKEETPKLGRIFIQGKCGYLKNESYKNENNGNKENDVNNEKIADDGKNADNGKNKKENVNELSGDKHENSQKFTDESQNKATELKNSSIDINFEKAEAENESSSVLKNSYTENINVENNIESDIESNIENNIENTDKEDKHIKNQDTEILHAESNEKADISILKINAEDSLDSEELNLKQEPYMETSPEEIISESTADLNIDLDADLDTDNPEINLNDKIYTGNFSVSQKKDNESINSEAYSADSAETGYNENMPVEENEKSEDYDFYDDMYEEKDYIKDFESSGGFNFRVSSSTSSSEKSSFKENFHEHEFLDEVSADLYKSLSADEMDNSLDYMPDMTLEDSEYYKDIKNLKFESKAIKPEDLIPEESTSYEVQDAEDEEEINVIPIYQEDIKGTKMIASLVSSLMEKDRNEREEAERNALNNSENNSENDAEDVQAKKEELLAVTINPADVEIIEEDQGIHTSDMRLPYKDVEIYEENSKMQNENDREMNNGIEMASFGGAFAVKK